jgi:hypothetical protein
MRGPASSANLREATMTTPATTAALDTRTSSDVGLESLSISLLARKFLRVAAPVASSSRYASPAANAISTYPRRADLSPRHSIVQRRRTMASGTFARGSKPGAMTDADTNAIVWVGGVERKPVAPTAPPASISSR